MLLKFRSNETPGIIFVYGYKDAFTPHGKVKPADFSVSPAMLLGCIVKPQGPKTDGYVYIGYNRSDNKDASLDTPQPYSELKEKVIAHYTNVDFDGLQEAIKTSCSALA